MIFHFSLPIPSFFFFHLLLPASIHHRTFPHSGFLLLLATPSMHRLLHQPHLRQPAAQFTTATLLALMARWTPFSPTTFCFHSSATDPSSSNPNPFHSSYTFSSNSSTVSLSTTFRASLFNMSLISAGSISLDSTFKAKVLRHLSLKTCSKKIVYIAL